MPSSTSLDGIFSLNLKKKKKKEKKKENKAKNDSPRQVVTKDVEANAIKSDAQKCRQNCFQKCRGILKWRQHSRMSAKWWRSSRHATLKWPNQIVPDKPGKAQNSFLFLQMKEKRRCVERKTLHRPSRYRQECLPIRRNSERKRKRKKHLFRPKIRDCR